MIFITDITSNTSCYFEGTINEMPKKIGTNKIVSTRGQRFQEFVRGVIDLQISIDYITEEEYSYLKLIFLSGKSKLYIEDKFSGKVYLDYLIDDDTLNFKRHEDYDNKLAFYKGNINLVKI